MNYASVQDMIDRYGATELAQRSNRVDGATVDETVVTRALDDATAEIDSYLTTRYTLPLATVPPVITRLTCDIARYQLHDDGAPETVRTRYEDAVSLLKKFSSGDVCLVGAQAQATAGDANVYYSFSPRQITDDILRGFA